VQPLHLKDPPCDTQVIAFPSSSHFGSDVVDTISDVVIIKDVVVIVDVNVGAGVGAGVD